MKFYFHGSHSLLLMEGYVGVMSLQLGFKIVYFVFGFNGQIG